jgi:hypothetical protein
MIKLSSKKTAAFMGLTPDNFRYKLRKHLELQALIVSGKVQIANPEKQPELCVRQENIIQDLRQFIKIWLTTNDEFKLCNVIHKALKILEANPHKSFNIKVDAKGHFVLKLAKTADTSEQTFRFKTFRPAKNQALAAEVWFPGYEKWSFAKLDKLNKLVFRLMKDIIFDTILTEIEREQNAT